ncbi:MAG TPA: matrixin family metalloprotease, partial [Lacipirellula sp.]
MKPFASNARPSKSTRSLRAERLEPRAMLHGGPGLWAADGDLTLSFAPDGTNIAGAQSSLSSTLNALAPEADWKDAVLRAFQTWASHTAASIGVVEDSGDAFGVAGSSRGDPRFGDIRVGAAPLDEGVFAIAVPSTDVVSGTWVGDVIINSNAAFVSLEDVFAVALHEAGHVLGLAHSEDPNSPMHVHGATPATTLTPADILAVQAIYGSPQHHFNERATANDTLSSATQLKLNSTLSGGPGSAPSLVYGAITSSSDVDYFRLATPPNYLGAVDITLRTAGVSLLASHVEAFDSSGALLGESASASRESDPPAIVLAAAPADGQIFIRVTSADGGVFSVGDYALVAVFETLNEVSADVIAAASNGAFRTLSQQELEKVLRESSPNLNEISGDDDIAAAVTLTPSRGFSPNSRYETIGSIGRPGDVDYVKVTPPVFGSGTMTIRVRTLQQNSSTPEVVVFDKNNQPRPATVLVNGHGEYVVQVTGDGSNESVSFSISASDSAGARATGSYQLVVDFNGEPVGLDPALAAVITPDAPVRETPFYVALPHLFHFALAVPSAPSTPDAVVMVSIRDADENVVFRVASRPGETRTAGSVLLAPGAYRIQVAALTGEPLSGDIAFTLFAKASSGPFAANPDDPTYQPEFQCEEPGHEGLYCYPGHFTS